MVLRKEGTTAYWKAAFHAPAFEDESFFPLLVADAVLNGAAGLNIWSGGGVSRPQRSARLYRALVDKGLASSVSGALMPTQHPYLYGINASVAEGQTLGAVEEVVLAEIDRLRADGITPDELKKVHAQLRARFVYDGDSVTDIAHQTRLLRDDRVVARRITTLRSRLDAVTIEPCRPPRRNTSRRRTARSAGSSRCRRETRAAARAVLDNGVTVIAKSNHTTPAVSMLVGVRTGAYADPPDRDGTAALCARVLDRGTVTRSAEAIADDLDGRGASLSVAAGRHQMAIAATCLTDDFRDGARARRRHRAASALCRRRDRDAAREPDHVDPAGRRQPGVDGRSMRSCKALYGAHPYARKVRGTIAGDRSDPPPGSRPLPPEGLRSAGDHRDRRRRRRGRGGALPPCRSCSATGSAAPPPALSAADRPSVTVPGCRRRPPSAGWCRCR